MLLPIWTCTCNCLVINVYKVCMDCKIQYKQNTNNVRLVTRKLQWDTLPQGALYVLNLHLTFQSNVLHSITDCKSGISIETYIPVHTWYILSKWLETTLHTYPFVCNKITRYRCNTYSNMSQNMIRRFFVYAIQMRDYIL